MKGALKPIALSCRQGQKPILKRLNERISKLKARLVHKKNICFWRLSVRCDDWPRSKNGTTQSSKTQKGRDGLSCFSNCFVVATDKERVFLVKAKIIETVLNSRTARAVSSARLHRAFDLLRSRRQWPGGYSADHRDELTPLHLTESHPRCP
jgi:hypothetical protein